jgi:hypothetical protein
MSHFLTIPINENGIILDERFKDELQTAATDPFAFTDVFLYAHGWWNTASSASAEYNIFSLGFAKALQGLSRPRQRAARRATGRGSIQISTCRRSTTCWRASSANESCQRGDLQE